MYSLENKKIFASLESLRGIASLYVVIGHARFILFMSVSQYILINPISTLNYIEIILLLINLIFTYGIAFVILFFIISGFSIDHSLQRIVCKENLENAKSMKNIFKSFYFRRIIRIYIPYVMAIIFSLIILYTITLINQDLVHNELGTETYDNLKKSILVSFDPYFIIHSLFYNLIEPIKEGVYIGNNQPFWTLGIEVFFYILAPVLLLYTNSKILIFIIFIGFLQGIFTFTNNHISLFLLQFLTFIPFFLMGALLRRNLDIIIYYLNKNKINPLLLLACAFVLFSIAFILKALKIIYPSYIVVSLSFLFFILFVFSNHFISIKIVHLFEKIGEMSYTMYLVHYPILLLILSIYTRVTSNYYINNLFLFLFGSVVAVFVAYLLYQIGEKQTQKYLSKTRQ
jgi:peptidoglycan/LPS O-acetylase OafA/YrhL